MKAFSFWQHWLLIAGIVLAVFGVLMALLSATPLFEVFNRQIDPAFWSSDNIEAGARLFQQWIYGVWGATIAGWGIFTAFIAYYPFRNGEKWAWSCLGAGLLVWFVLDTSLSLVHRVYFNVAFNMAVLAIMLLPLAFSRRYFFH